MTTELRLYDAASHALAEAVRVDEVVAIRTQATAFAAYARMAKDPELINQATALRLRAERRAGELLIAMKKSGERAAPEDGRPPSQDKPRTDTRLLDQPAPQTLEEIGISKDQSSRWQRVAQLPAKEFEERVAQTQRLATQSVTTTPFERAQEKKTKRAAREVELGAKLKALPNARYGVIVADPPWAFEPYSRETGMDRAADNHYPTQGLEDIAKTDVASIAADDCALFLWATAPMLHEAMWLIDEWGFEYKSHIIWLKDRVGTGYWTRSKHELLLIGTRGKFVAPAPGTQWLSVVEAAVAEHSKKPEIFFEWVEENWPSLPKIELNRRGPAREGWVAHGLEYEEAQ